MIELTFSHFEEPSPTLRRIVADFEEKNGVKVNFKVVKWENAWRELLSWSIYEEGVDVSQIGSTWGSSLMALNALRPFKNDEVSAIGGQFAFLPQAWQSGKAPISIHIWSLPWTTYTFLIAYRRSMLAKADIDEPTAFSTTELLASTLNKLQDGGCQYPWVVSIGEHNLDTLHCISSWVWGAAGDFVTPDNIHVGFTQPDPFRAMQRYFGPLRFMKPMTLPIDTTAALQSFLDGDAAVTLLGAGSAYRLMHDTNLPVEIREDIGFASMPGVPWVGGDNLVIWKHISTEPEREKAAVGLVQHLLSHESQVAYASSEDFNIPARLDAFDALPMRDSQLTRAINRSLRTGRAYRSLTSWSKIEHRFGVTLGRIGAEILNGSDVDESTRTHLKQFAQWLEIILQ